jgi:hypothetical protein
MPNFIGAPAQQAEFTKPVWLAFDPEHGKGARPDSLWGQPDLAASEVLSGLIQFPRWCLYWRKGSSYPILNVCFADSQLDAGASPSVREC